MRAVGTIAVLGAGVALLGSLAGGRLAHASAPDGETRLWSDLAVPLPGPPLPGPLFADGEVPPFDGAAALLFSMADTVDAAPAGGRIAPVDSLKTVFNAADSAGAGSARGGTAGPGSDSADRRPRPRQIEQPPSVAWTTVRSGLVPGWGQLVNKKPLKAGLCFGAWAFFAGQAVVAERDRKDAQRAFDTTGNATDMEAVNDAVDRRNARFWWMGGVAVFSMLDAYVDVHFWGFEDQWRVRLRPAADGVTRVGLNLKFK